MVPVTDILAKQQEHALAQPLTNTALVRGPVLLAGLVKWGYKVGKKGKQTQSDSLFKQPTANS